MEYAGIWTSEQEFINKFDSVSVVRMLGFEMLNLKKDSEELKYRPKVLIHSVLKNQDSLKDSLKYLFLLDSA